jgi:hypothetical protein
MDYSQIQVGIDRYRVLRRCAVLLVVALLVVSCFVAKMQTARTVFAVLSIAVAMLAVELTADVGNRLSRRERWRIRPQSITKAQVLREIVNILIHAIVVWIALQILLHPRNFGNFTNELLRLGAGVALLYASAAIIFGVISLLFEAAGYSSPQLHRHPIAARSVGEFWGRRWNIIVSAWLRTFVFLPIARRNHIGLGIILAFLASGILHGWLILFSVGLWGALSQVLFFVIQGVVVLAENRLRIDEWPVAIARAWTLIILLATSPLFIDPGLRFFGL